MKASKIKIIFISFLIIFTLTASGCNTGSDNVDNQNIDTVAEAPKTLEGDQFKVLQSITDKVLKAGIEFITPNEVYEKVVLEDDINYFVVDIRSPQSFAAGHIKGAVNIPYNFSAKVNAIENLPKDKKIIIACYSGHTASQTAFLWKSLGYDVIPMLNGMGGWTTTQGVGSPLPKSAFNYPVVTEVPKTSSYSLPSIHINNIKDTEALILSQSDSYLATGKGPIIKPAEIMSDLQKQEKSYFLIDVRDQDDYAQGHIEGAINIPFQNIAEVNNLEKIPMNQKVVIIGYSGSEASFVVRALNQFGYDTYAMFQGMRVWTSDANINGIAPVQEEIVKDLPLEKLNYDLDGGSSGSASCG